MKAIVILDKKRATVVMTELNNIDWLDKSIIDNTAIQELEYLLDDTISVYDIDKKKSVEIKVNELRTEKHQMIIDKKLFVALHVLK